MLVKFKTNGHIILAAADPLAAAGVDPGTIGLPASSSTKAVRVERGDTMDLPRSIAGHHIRHDVAQPVVDRLGLRFVWLAGSIAGETDLPLEDFDRVVLLDTTLEGLGALMGRPAPVGFFAKDLATLV